MAKSTKKPAPKRKRLNERRALEALSRGAKPARVAKAAGSTARTQKKLGDVGRALIRRLRDKGQITEAFAAAGYDVQQFAQDVVQQALSANKITRIVIKGELFEFVDVDHQARTAAREQFARAVGLTDLPPDTNVQVNVMHQLDDALLVRLAAGQLSSQELAKIAQTIGHPGHAAG